MVTYTKPQQRKKEETHCWNPKGLLSKNYKSLLTYFGRFTRQSGGGGGGGQSEEKSDC